MRDSKMTERTISPQVRINTRTLEVVSELRGDLNGHKDMDSLQFATVRAELTEIKGDIKQLNNDAKRAIDDLADRQENYHKTNSATLTDLKFSINALTSERAGANGVGGLLIKLAPIFLSLATLAFWIWGRH